MTVAQVWFAIWTAICLFFCKKHEKISALLKKEIVFQYRRHTILYKFYNIKEILQCRFCSSPTITRHMSRSREAFYIWLYAGLQDTMLAVLSRVLSWYVSQSYLLLDVFFFLSLKKNPYFYSQLIVVTCRLSFSASTDHIFKHSVHCFLPSLYSITSYFMYE